MAVCPWCGTTIAKYFMNRNCPKCGKQLGNNASSDATLATIEGSTFQEAIDNFEKQQNVEILSTVDWQDPAVTLDTSDLAGVATVEQETVVPPEVSQLTLDASSNTSTAADVTLDAPSLSTGSSLGSGSVGTEQTLDSESLGSNSSIYKSAEVRRIWEKAAGANIDPAYSLSKGAVDVSDSVYEGISIRNLNIDASVITFDADYQIRSELGRGKQGVVYAARQKGLGRTVAIKLVLKGSSGRIERDRLNRFVREAEITAALDHPNILPIHELAITSAGELFYAMKKVDGRAWNEILADKKTSLHENVECLLKVCDAIAFAHSKRVIHRDLKPGNIMIGGFGEVLVADWGLAVDLSKFENFQATRDQKDPFSFGGTPAYMSPEMAKHDWPRIGTRSDIYLLGAILYHLVVGKPPRDGRTVYEVLERARANYYIPVEHPTGLLAVALKAMETNPADRYETVEEFQEAIREVNRHAESSRLSDHAAALLEAAKNTSDYSKFNEAIFSFRNAIDLWNENKPAIDGLRAARIAYSENAISRGDFDVCLETLDSNDPEESVLYSKAQQAQSEARTRGIRYRRLRRVATAGAVIALSILSALSFWLWISIDQARVAEKQAQESEFIAKTEAENARKQQNIATAEANRARSAEDAARRSEEKAIDARDVANKTAQELSETNQKLAAETLRKEEERARAEQKSIEALYNERIAKLGGYQSSLLSAFNLAESYNVRRSGALLQDIRSLQESMLSAAPELDESMNGDWQINALVQTPQLTTWPYRRVGALIGSGLPRLCLNFNVSCLDIARAKPLAIVGSAAGNKSELQLIKFGDGQIVKVAESHQTVDRSIQAVAISPDGREVVFICKGGTRAEPGAFYWDLDTNKVVPIVELKNRQMQWAAFSPDGKHLLMGLSGGIYRWPRKGRLNFEDTKPSVYGCRGILGDIQFDAAEPECQTALCNVVQDVPSRGTRKLACYELDLNSDRFVALEIPAEVARQATTTARLGSRGDLCVGTEDGRLMLYRPSEDSSSSQVEMKFVGELYPRLHQTRILRIRPLDQRSFLSIGQDNAIQLWKAERASSSYVASGSVGTVGTNELQDSDDKGVSVAGWRHDLSLRGLPDSAVDGHFYNDGRNVLAVDQSGNCMDWNVIEQADRLRMNAPESATGMVAIGGVGAGGTNWWIDSEGMLQLWGRGTEVAQRSLQFPGHTPQAEFVDLVMSQDSGRVVSVARLTERSNPYRTSTTPALEFCVWDLSNGKMLHRWEQPSATPARIALVSGGQKLLWVNESATFLCELDGSKLRMLRNQGEDIGAVEIAQHPQNPSWVALIGDKGEVWLLDLAQDAKVIHYNRDWAFEVANVHLLRAAWNPSGTRIYMLRNASEKNDMALVSVDWEGDKLSQNISRNDRLLGLQFPSRPDFMHVADMQIQTVDDDEEIVGVAVRYRYSNGAGEIFEAWSAKVQFSDRAQPQVISAQHSEKVWLTADLHLQTQAELNQALRREPNGFFKVEPIRDGSLLTVVDIGTGGFLPVVKDSPVNRIATFGRTRCIAADGTADGKSWLTLHEGGEIWWATLESNGSVTWNCVSDKLTEILDFEQLEGLRLGPSGTMALLTGRTKLSKGTVLVDLAEARVIKKWDGMEQSAWHPDGSQVALATKNGLLKLYQLADGYETQNQFLVDELGSTDLRLERIVWFRENLIGKQSSISTKWYVLAQMGERRLYLCSLETKRNDAAFEPIILDSSITAVACSPVDNSIAIAVNGGSISTWFASPTVDRVPRELFSIDAHRGAIVSDLRFARDGLTLFSADAPETKTLTSHRGRGLGWVSVETTEN